MRTSEPSRARSRTIAASGTTPDPPADEQERPAVLRPPREPAADRAAQLDLVAVAQLLAQVPGHLAVGQHLDRQLDALGGWGRIHGVAIE